MSRSTICKPKRDIKNIKPIIDVPIATQMSALSSEEVKDINFGTLSLILVACGARTAYMSTDTVSTKSITPLLAKSVNERLINVERKGSTCVIYVNKEWAAGDGKDIITAYRRADTKMVVQTLGALLGYYTPLKDLHRSYGTPRTTYEIVCRIGSVKHQLFVFVDHAVPKQDLVSRLKVDAARMRDVIVSLYGTVKRRCTVCTRVSEHVDV